MAEREVAYVPTTAGDVIEYKPLSAPAVIGLGVALIYAAIVLIYGVAAMLKGEPLFLGGWTMALPIAGAVLSGVAMWQIHGAEGTRAGGGLARCGMGICVVLGLGYWTYQTFTGLAILQQANRFLLEKDEHSGFFPRLRGNEVDVRTAYLYTLDIGDRTARPENAKDFQNLNLPSEKTPKGPFTEFWEHPLVRLLHGTAASSSEAVVEALPVHGWSYDTGAYQIARGYRITTEEGVFEVALGVSSIEPATAGERRYWRVNWHPKIPVTPVSRTALGIKRQGLRQRVLDFLLEPKSGWIGNLLRRKSFELYLGMQPAQKRKELRERAAAVVGTPLTALVGGATAYVTSGDDLVHLSRLLPGYRPVGQVAEYFNFDNFRNWDPDPRAQGPVKAAVIQAMAPNVIHQLSMRMLPLDFAPCEVHGDEVTIGCQALFTVEVLFETGVRMPVVVQLDLVVAAPADLDPTAADAVQQLRVKSLEIVRAWPNTEKPS